MIARRMMTRSQQCWLSGARAMHGGPVVPAGEGHHKHVLRRLRAEPRAASGAARTPDAPPGGDAALRAGGLPFRDRPAGLLSARARARGHAA